MGFIAGAITQTADRAPLQGLIESIMRGNAETQAQAQVKEIYGKQESAAKKLSVTMTANPDDPGNPLLHIKNATADQINQTQGSDLRNAYEAPHKNVDDAIAAGAASPPPSPQSTPSADDLENQGLRAIGVDPDKRFPTHRTAEDLSTYGQDYHFQRVMGSGVVKSAIMAGLMKSGLFNRDEAAQHINEANVDAKARMFHNYALPVLQEQDRQARLNRSEEALSNTMAHQRDVENRLLRSQSDAEQKTIYAHHNAINKGIDYSQIDPGPNNENWHKAFDDQNDTGVSATPQQYAAIDRTGAQRVNAAFLDYTDTKKDTFALGNQPTWEAAKAAFGHPLTPDQDRMGKARWQAAHTYAVRKAADDASMQEGRAAKLEHLQYLNEHQGDVKPVALDDSFVKGVSASDLLSVLPTVKNPDIVLQRKEALLRNEIQDRSEKLRKAQKDTVALNSMKPGERRFNWPVDLANAQVDAKTHADRITAAKDELQQIQAARAARAGGTKPTAAPAKKPDPLGIR